MHQNEYLWSKGLTLSAPMLPLIAFTNDVDTDQTRENKHSDNQSTQSGVDA